MAGILLKYHDLNTYKMYSVVLPLFFPRTKKQIIRIFEKKKKLERTKTTSTSTSKTKTAKTTNTHCTDNGNTGDDYTRSRRGTITTKHVYKQ